MTLLVHPKHLSADGVTIDITPEGAGWRYVGFRLVKLKEGARYSSREAGREACLVLLTGTADLLADSEPFAHLGGRADLFADSPTSVYLPANIPYEVGAVTDLEFAVCTAPASGTKPVRLIAPEQVGQETRGTGGNTRYIRNILPDSSDIAESLLVVEVITPGGNWSSYPPHKHDVAAWPNETLLEETYYHRMKRPGGFAFQRVYTDDRSLDETLAVGDGDAVMVPRGYHPVSAAHGYDLYYLNVMAGPRRAWRFTNDPEHDWIIRN